MICQKVGCGNPIGPGGQKLPEGSLCKQCAEQLRRMRAAPLGTTHVGVVLKHLRKVVIFADQTSTRGSRI